MFFFRVFEGRVSRSRSQLLVAQKGVIFYEVLEDLPPVDLDKLLLVLSPEKLIEMLHRHFSGAWTEWQFRHQYELLSEMALYFEHIL